MPGSVILPSILISGNNFFGILWNMPEQTVNKIEADKPDRIQGMIQFSATFDFHLNHKHEDRSPHHNQALL